MQKACGQWRKLGLRKNDQLRKRGGKRGGARHEEYFGFFELKRVGIKSQHWKHYVDLASVYEWGFPIENQGRGWASQRKVFRKIVYTDCLLFLHVDWDEIPSSLTRQVLEAWGKRGTGGGEWILALKSIGDLLHVSAEWVSSAQAYTTLLLETSRPLKLSDQRGWSSLRQLSSFETHNWSWKQQIPTYHPFNKMPQSS